VSSELGETVGERVCLVLSFSIFIYKFRFGRLVRNVLWSENGRGLGDRRCWVGCLHFGCACGGVSLLIETWGAVGLAFLFVL